MKAKHPFTIFLLKMGLVFIFSVQFLYIQGCAKKEERTFRGQTTPGVSKISKEELRQALNKFEKFAVLTITELTDEVERLQPDLKTRKVNVMKRERLKQGFHTMVEQDDPVIAFIETWALSVRLTNYIKQGEGSRLFPEHWEMVLASVEKIQAEIERIGAIFLEGDRFTETQSKIYQFANSNPIRGTFSNVVIYATEVKPGEPGLFDEVVGIPMAPFKAMGGVDRTASAIYSVRESADRFSDVVEEMPESVRWQLLLLLLEMEETEMVKTTLKSMSQFSESSARLVEVSESLPEDIRKELSILVEEIDEKQDNIQETLKQAQKTSENIEQALDKAEKVAVSFETTFESINQTAAAWEKAATATEKALNEIVEIKKPNENAKKDKPPFNIHDYKDTANAVGTTVAEIRKLTADFRELIESEQMAEQAFMPRKLVNLLAWRIGQLIFLAFALALLYRFIVKRFLSPSHQNNG